MKKISLKKLDLNCYVETLQNDLDVILIPYKDKNNYYISYVTRFGSDINTFVPAGLKKYIKISNGTAHFLEHKMFEQKDGVDPFTFFSESGTGANAFTSFDSTQYICYGTKELEKNLKFLLKFVNSPYFTDDNVEKEKGIIKEEIKMQEDVPEWILDTKLREGLYNVHPRRISIAGSCEDIDGITKEELYKGYNTFYQPNNMFLVVAGNFSETAIMDIIRKSLEKKKNTQSSIKYKKVKEPLEVASKDIELSLNLKIPKIALGYKMQESLFQTKNKFELDLYLYMFASLLFGPASNFKERVRNNNLMTNFYYEWETVNGYKTLIILAETENPELFIDEVEKELKNIKIIEEDIERIKKVWISNEVKTVDSIENIVSNIVYDQIKYNKLIDNKVDIINSLNKKKLDTIVSKMNFTNRTKVILLPNKIITKES